MDRRAAEGSLQLDIAGRRIACRFARRRRRTIGLAVDATGLSISAPLRAPWREIEAFVRHKERWIVRKLDEWAALPRAPVLHGVSGESLPLYGAPVTLDVSTARSAVRHEPGRLRVAAPKPERVIQVLVSWLKSQALEVLEPRAAHFAARLGVSVPQVALSNARAQWGVCCEGGIIRLNWRLVHLEPDLADYVVAHEVAHLVELNHSRRFWNLVSALYPDWRAARKHLELADASLPILGVS